MTRILLVIPSKVVAAVVWWMLGQGSCYVYFVPWNLLCSSHPPAITNSSLRYAHQLLTVHILHHFAYYKPYSSSRFCSHPSLILSIRILTLFVFFVVFAGPPGLRTMHALMA